MKLTRNNNDIPNKKLLIVLGVVPLVVVIFVILRAIIPSSPSETPPGGQPSPFPQILQQETPLDQVTPQQTKDEVTTAIGEPQNTETDEEGDTLLYPSDYAHESNRVILKDDKVDLIKEEVTAQKKKIIDYLPEPSSTPLKLYTFEGGETSPLYVYAQDGVAFIAHMSDQTVFQIWRFQPMTNTQFLSKYNDQVFSEEVFEALKQE